jgi:mono/diheme cytochrome c family protein
MTRRLKWALLVSLGAVAVAVSAVAALAWWAQGFSARPEPPALEKRVARRLRALSRPREVKGLVNPVPPTPEALSEARAHFADHCASCHGNDGRGRTEIGQHLYPRAPDMTGPDTQSLTDGEIFHAIKYGVRLTGMPASGAEGSKEDDLATWKLVHFIRHLPALAPGEVQEMEKLNPKGPEEMMSREDEDAFLAGQAPAPARPAVHQH